VILDNVHTLCGRVCDKPLDPKLWTLKKQGWSCPECLRFMAGLVAFHILNQVVMLSVLLAKECVEAGVSIPKMWRKE